MGGKARWRKLQRVVGCLPQGSHASLDKPRQRRERARTRDAKRRRLGDDGEEEAATILIGAKKEINKEEEEHRACEEKSEGDKGTEKPNEQQEIKVKTQLNDNDINSCNDNKVQEAMEQRAGVWTACPSGWVFRPLNDTTLEEELRKAQEEEEENGRKDRVHENGQRLAKFFLSDDESDSDTAIFIDAYQPVLTENNNLGSPATPVPASQSPCEMSLESLLANSSGFPVQSRVQVPMEAEDVELVIADATEEDEITETLDPLARITTMEAVMTDSPCRDSQRGDLPSNILDPGTAPDLVGTDPCIESAKSSTNRQPSCTNMTDVVVSSGRSAQDRTYRMNSGSIDDRVVESEMTMKTGRQADATQDTLHLEVDTESHFMPDTFTPSVQIISTMNTEVSNENCTRPKLDCYDNLEQESQDAHATLYKGDSEAESLFFSLYPEYHPGELEESESQEAENRVTTSSKDKYLCSQSPYETPQVSEESMNAASQEVYAQDRARQLKDFQQVYDGSQTINLARDVSAEASLTTVLDHAATFTSDIKSTTLHKSRSFHHELHQLDSSADQQRGVEETGAEAGQDALELETTLEIERASQTLVGKAREWIKGVARMGGTKKGDSSEKLLILESTEDTSSFGTETTVADGEVFTALTDTVDDTPAEVLTGLASGEEIKVHYTPEGDQEVCFTSAERVKDLSIQQTLQSNVNLHSSPKRDSYSCFLPDEDVPEDPTPVQDPKKHSGSGNITNTLPGLMQDPEVDEGDEPTQDYVQDSLSTENHYLPDENIHYFTPANEPRDYFTPGKATDQLMSTTALQACYPLPEPTLQHTYPQMLTYSKPTAPATPRKDSKLRYPPEEEMNTTYTPVGEVKIIYSSIELLQPHYTPEKESAIHATLTQKLEAHDTPEEEAFHTPDTKDLNQYYTPVEHSTCHTPADKYRTYFSKEEDHYFSTPVEEENYHYTPAKGTNNYKPVEEQEIDYIPEEEEGKEEEQTTSYNTEDKENHATPTEEQRFLDTPEKDVLVEPHTPEEEEKVHHTSEEQHKGYHTPVEEHWPHYTPADERYPYFTPTEEINRFSTPAEEEETNYTPEDYPNTPHTSAEEAITHYTSDNKTSTCDEKQNIHNTPDTTLNTASYTPADKWEHYYTPVAETNILSEPAEENPHHYTPKSKLTTPTEGMTLSTCENELESRYIPDSHLETHDTPAGVEEQEQQEEEEAEEEEDEKAERRVEDGEDADKEGKRDDHIKWDINKRKRAESKREERKESESDRRDSERERKDSEREKRDSERERKDSERERKDSEREKKYSERDRRDSERQGRKDSDREGRKDSEREGRKDSEREGRKDSERERKDSEREERKHSEMEETKYNERERRDSEREGRKDGERERRDSEREDSERKRIDSDMKGRKDSERERKDSEKERKNSDRKGRKDSERERKDSERKRKDSDRERKDSDRERKESDRERTDSEREMKDSEKERKDSEKDRNNSERERKDSEERKDSGKERKDSEKDRNNSERERKDSEERKDRGKERKDSERETNNSQQEGKVNNESTEKERRRPSDWEWRRNSGGEERRNSDWERRRKNEGNVKDAEMEGKKESMREGSTEEHTSSQGASATLDLGHNQAEDALPVTMSSRTESDNATLDSHATSETKGISGATAPCNLSEPVTPKNTTEHTGVPQHEMRGGRGESSRDDKPHQRHGKARRQLTGTGDGDNVGNPAPEAEYLKDPKKEKSGSKRRRSRRNKGRYQGERETSIPQSQSAIGGDRTASRTAEPKSHLSQESSWGMETSYEREIHYHAKNYPLQRQQESCFSREILESSGTSGVLQKPMLAHQDDIVAAPRFCKKLNKNVSYQNKQHQAEHKLKFCDGHTRDGRRRVERFSEEQKDTGAGEFAVSESLAPAGSKGAQDGEKKRGKGNEKGSRRIKYGEEIHQEKLVQGGGESGDRPVLSRVWSPRIERKDRKESKKERKERNFSDKPGEEFKKAEITSPREELSKAAAGRGGSGALQSRPPLLATPAPVETLTISAAQKQQMNPTTHMTSGSLLGLPPSPLPSRTQAKLKYPEALLQPLSPPPSPPLHKPREMKEKTKPTSGEMEKIRESSLPSDSPSYARKASSQSVMYTIPETALATPQQTEQSSPHSHDSDVLQDPPPCSPKRISFKNTVERHKPDSPKTSQPVSVQGKQKHGSSSDKSLPSASYDSLQSATRPSGLTTSSLADPQPLVKQVTSPSHPSTPLLPLPLQQESMGVSIVTPASKTLLKSKPSLSELDAMHKVTSTEVENMSSGNSKSGGEEARPLGSPGRISVAQRIKFPEASQSTTEYKSDMSKGGAASCKPDLTQARSTAAAKLPVASEDGDGAALSLRQTSSSPMEGSLPRSRDARLMKKRRR